MNALESKFSFIKRSHNTTQIHPLSALDKIPTSAYDIWNSITEIRKRLIPLLTQRIKNCSFMKEKSIRLDATPDLPGEVLYPALRNSYRQFALNQTQLLRQLESSLSTSLAEVDKVTTAIKKKHERLVKMSEKLLRDKKKFTDSAQNYANPEQRKSNQENLDEQQHVFDSLVESFTCDLYAFGRTQTEMLNMLSFYLDSEADFHRQCMHAIDDCRVVVDNLKAINEEHRVFEKTISSHLNSQGISIVLDKCISFLLAKQHYTNLGIFRTAAQQSKIDLLKNAFNMELVDSEVLDFCGSGVVADIIKIFLRGLSESLLTNDGIDLFNNLPEKPCVDDVSRVLNELPEVNFRNLAYLIHFLRIVADNSAENLMPPTSLSIVFAPNLFRKPNDENPFTNSLGYKVVEMMIEHCDEIFSSESAGEFRLSPIPPEERCVTNLPLPDRTEEMNEASLTVTKSPIPPRHESNHLPSAGPPMARPEKLPTKHPGGKPSAPRPPALREAIRPKESDLPLEETLSASKLETDSEKPNFESSDDLKVEETVLSDNLATERQSSKAETLAPQRPSLDGGSDEPEDVERAETGRCSADAPYMCTSKKPPPNESEATVGLQNLQTPEEANPLQPDPNVGLTAGKKTANEESRPERTQSPVVLLKKYSLDSAVLGSRSERDCEKTALENVEVAKEAGETKQTRNSMLFWKQIESTKQHFPPQRPSVGPTPSKPPLKP